MKKPHIKKDADGIWTCNGYRGLSFSECYWYWYDHWHQLGWIRRRANT